MVKKNRLLSTSFREIKNNFPTFLSLLIMSFLGAFVYSGLKATTPAMMNTLDAYLKENNYYDISLVSSIGFNEEDLSSLDEIEGIKKYVPSKIVDTTFKDDNDYVIRIHDITPDINKITSSYDIATLKDDEILLDYTFFKNTNYQIGDYITINNDSLNNKEFKIVGEVKSSLYFSNVEVGGGYGKTNVGTGNINFIAYVNENVINTSYYSYIYIRAEGVDNYQTNSSEYNNKVEKLVNEIKLINDNLLLNRKSELDTKLKQGELMYNLIINNGYTNETAAPILKELGYSSIEELKESLDSGKILLNNASITYNTRLSDSTYNGYLDNTDSMTKISYVFPVVFYAVAILVSLVSMNRMVEDDRQLIGTFKSLGFNNRHILFKYLLFASLATLTGGIFGVGLGVVILPSLINNIYKLLYSIPFFNLTLNLGQSLIGLLISLICILGTTLYTVFKELKEKPASLLRPKTPKAGRKILVERIPSLWKKIKFSNKVSIRNIFRYKKRVLVTIFGVAGCTALMLCGFGIRDSVLKIPSFQFEKVQTFDASIYINNCEEESLNEILSRKEIKSYSKTTYLSGTLMDTSININVLGKNYEEFYHFYKISDGTITSLNDDEIIITEKLATSLKLKEQDEITFQDSNNFTYTYKIGAVIENYVRHYIFMNETTYLNATGKKNDVNLVYASLIKMNEEEKTTFTSDLLKNDEVLNVSYIQEQMDSINNMLQSLNSVVYILVILSMMLSFIVLYNLSSINIHERKREIATLKVLGFYPREVDNYINKETVILTIVGIALGLFGGYFLTNGVVSTIEISYVRFIHEINWYSYVFSSLLALTFTLIVNLITHFTLKRINMIDSLKSVE